MNIIIVQQAKNNMVFLKLLKKSKGGYVCVFHPMVFRVFVFGHRTTTNAGINTFMCHVEHLNLYDSFPYFDFPTFLKKSEVK